MPTDTKLQNLIINDLTEEQYKALTPNENELYLTPSEDAIYRHQMGITKAPIVVYFEFYSSNKLECTSLTHLKTLLGSTFTHSATGSDVANNKIVMSVSESSIYFTDGTQEILSNATFKDTVTSI